MEKEDKLDPKNSDFNKAASDDIVLRKNLSAKIKVFFKNPKKRIIFIIIILTVILISVGLYFLLFRKTADTVASQDKIEQKTDISETPVQTTLFQSPIDGVMTDQASSLKHPLAIVVENHVESRPQSGLDKASLVYEAIAEGGITRFLAIFTTNEAEKVGPVRSARTFFVDWAHGFNAYLAHVGGNMDALDKITAEKTNDLDQFKYSSPYWREYSAGLATEHTMYTSTTKLREQAKTNSYSTENNFTVYKFKDDADISNRPENQKINVDFSNQSYNTSYIYDKASNSYKRSVAGKPHVDRISKDQISPKNLIIMTVKRKPVITRINEEGFEMTTVGSGPAKMFIDGKEIGGTWKKNSASEREVFYDNTGTEIVFNRGQFWISVIPPESSVTVQ